MRETEGVVTFVWPSGAVLGPHSPFAAVLVRLQSGKKLPFASPHPRNALRTRVLIGLFAVAVADLEPHEGPWPATGCSVCAALPM